MEKKKLAIVAEIELMVTLISDKSTQLKFEWSFRE
jgi:hypothetical protein